MHIAYLLIIVGIAFSIPIMSLSPFISAEAREIMLELWFNKGIPLSIGLCIGLCIGSDMQAKYAAALKAEMKEAIRDGLNKIQNNS